MEVIPINVALKPTCREWRGIVGALAKTNSLPMRFFEKNRISAKNRHFRLPVATDKKPQSFQIFVLTKT